MFQSFESQSDPTTGPARLALLRQELARRGLDGFLVPLADEFQGEYIPGSAKRLAWLTGFTGSAGICVVLGEVAALFVDGRYTLQADQQTSREAFTIAHVVEEPPHRWLKAKAASGQRIAFDPWLHTGAEVERFERALDGSGITLVPVDDNPIDAIWADRPAAPVGAVSLYPEVLAGQPASAKIAAVQGELVREGVGATVFALTESIAWLLNIRGQDIPRTPMPLAFAILPATGRGTLFIDPRKVGADIRPDIEALVDLQPFEAFTGALERLSAGGTRILVDAASAAAKISMVIRDAGGTVVDRRDPTILMKARKLPAELEATRGAHRRDAVAMLRFLAWFDREAIKGELDEITAAARLEAFRTETGKLLDLSFDTISGAGPNSALPHYRVSRETNRPIRSGEIYLIDSGGQYLDGTTDITRTLAVGEPTAEMRDRNTRVLKGHIAIATARFPKGTTGAHLDALARLPLWTAGLDFDHGTGHGVGVYMSVHEGPQRISKLSHVALEPGMILSNEPGYYRTGAFGIRIENLIIVTEASPIEGGDRPMMAFETITFAPFDRRLIDVSLLSPAERAWIDAYHAKVRSVLDGEITDPADRAFLESATRPLE